MNRRVTNQMIKCVSANEKLQGKIESLRSIKEDPKRLAKGEHLLTLDVADFLVMYECLTSHWRKQIQGNKLKLEKL